MWNLKFIATTNNTIVGKLATKYKVVVQLYPTLINRTGSDNIIHGYGVVFGKQSNKKKFIKEFNRLPEIISIKNYEDSFIAKYREKIHHATFYNPDILFIEPWMINGNTGKHYVSLGSWSRKDLVEIFNNIKNHHTTSLLSLKISKMTSPSMVFYTVRPQLTQKQKEALCLAVESGYYDYPRKTSIQKLAKISKLSFSTFQAHLRKAEKSIIPHSFKFINSDTYR
ncbi:MAG TPA: helix-turn-helix domain-containing protein [Alphaproteobacteria bacterium]|nr:helix-turn-helix domain-containing protein [Alphaproteobacteria bacterium]